MDFFLSPPCDPELKDEVRRLKHRSLVHAEATYAAFKDGHDGNIDYLALEEPLIKKRIQRQEQRAKKCDDPHPQTLEEQLARHMVEHWFAFKKEFAENFVTQQKLEQRMSVKVADNLTFAFNFDKLKFSKDRRLRMADVKVASVEKNRNAKTIHLFEGELLKVKNSSLSTPVPEPTPADGMFERNAVHTRKR